MSAVVGGVAVPDFAVHDRGADGLFGLVVRGLDVRLAKSREELGRLAAKMFDEEFVVGVGSVEARQHIELCRELVDQFVQAAAGAVSASVASA